MNSSTTIIKLSHPLAMSNFGFNYCDNDWQVPRSEEHPFVNSIREVVLGYRLQSASHFLTLIDVNQAVHGQNPGRTTELTPSFRVVVGFYNFGHEPLLRICRPKTRKRSRKSSRVLTNHIEVFEDDGFISLHDFLNMHFPTLDVPAGDAVMSAWWKENGKTFDWVGLPTELKEHIVQFCMHESSGYGNSSTLELRTKKRRSRKRGAFEITDQLGQWSSLLRVSRQVRAITLRLCFVGSSDLALDKGLCIDVSSYYKFKDCMRRLGKHYQMLEPNSVPVDETRVLAKTYKQFPKIYPQLKQYATFRHGIRKIRMQMGFMSCLHFFKVTVGNFQHWSRPYYLDYEVFQQLPHLNELIIKLPDPRGRLVDISSQPGPPLFYEDFACPRILHRFIYEQAAEVLAIYPNVKMHGFVDELEELRFEALRKTAVKALKFTSAELEELYTEDGGGIELDDYVFPGIQVQEKEEEQGDTRRTGDMTGTFWPPKCRCAVRCRKLLNPDQYIEPQ